MKINGGGGARFQKENEGESAPYQSRKNPTPCGTLDSDIKATKFIIEYNVQYSKNLIGLHAVDQ